MDHRQQKFARIFHSVGKRAIFFHISLSFTLLRFQFLTARVFIFRDELQRCLQWTHVSNVECLYCWSKFFFFFSNSLRSKANNRNEQEYFARQLYIFCFFFFSLACNGEANVVLWKLFITILQFTRLILPHINFRKSNEKEKKKKKKIAKFRLSRHVIEIETTLLYNLHTKNLWFLSRTLLLLQILWKLWKFIALWMRARARKKKLEIYPIIFSAFDFNQTEQFAIRIHSNPLEFHQWTNEQLEIEYKNQKNQQKKKHQNWDREWVREKKTNKQTNIEMK